MCIVTASSIVMIEHWHQERNVVVAEPGSSAPVMIDLDHRAVEVSYY